MSSFRVEVDGETVWTGDGDDYKVIPAKYRARPASGGAHVLLQDGEVIGTQLSQLDEDAWADAVVDDKTEGVDS